MLIPKDLLNSFELLKQFMKKEKISKIEELSDCLLTYDFHQIFENKEFEEFANVNGSKDGDRTKLSYAIYSIIWYEKMRELKITEFSEKNFEQYKNSFSGDTINTLYTLFGKDDQDRNKVLKFMDFSTSENKVFEEFCSLYQTIGNFYFLPKNTINRQSLNTYRGYVWNDFFDVFLMALRELIEEENFKDSDFKAIFNVNAYFFEKIKTIEEFLLIFYLKDEDENYNYLTDFVFEDKGFHFRHNMLNENNKAQYKAFVLDYMKKANILIKKRSKVLVRELQLNLERFGFSSFI